MSEPDSPLRRLPAIHQLLDDPRLADAIARRGREAAKSALRSVLDDLRARPDAIDEAAGAIVDRALARLEAPTDGLRRVINATGVLLNTGLGRAPLPHAATDAIAEVAAGYCNLEFDLDRGERGRRGDAVQGRLRRLVAAEAAVVVNNNAAATILALRALARGREVIVSRGQLVEIGGSFRLPEIFETAGVRLVEVGTTNRTRIDDYARAVGPNTAALLRVHTGNFKIVGFTESVAITDLAALGRERGIPVIDDIGSGALDPASTLGMPDEPDVRSSLAAGADVVLFSADKLLGGPQAGLIVGRSEHVAAAARDPLMRAFRVDKLTLAALETVLDLHERAPADLPLRRLASTPLAELEIRAREIAWALAHRLPAAAGVARSVATQAMIGGGSVPGETIDSFAVRIETPSDPSALAHALRLGRPAVVGRIHAGGLVLDLRAVFESEDGAIVDAVVSAAARADRPEIGDQIGK
ncbi:MAG: L-seryl-tRNA(Sec) selenium transferase [Isosphaeraceae bacterium]|nr:L-seryl-tRNA(Sec) selenium transferase [Isosphaeraceae bacterium]